jgi:hypothetical protein
MIKKINSNAAPVPLCCCCSLGFGPRSDLQKSLEISSFLQCPFLIGSLPLQHLAFCTTSSSILSLAHQPWPCVCCAREAQQQQQQQADSGDSNQRAMSTPRRQWQLCSGLSWLLQARQAGRRVPAQAPSSPSSRWSGPSCRANSAGCVAVIWQSSNLRATRSGGTCAKAVST